MYHRCISISHDSFVQLTSVTHNRTCKGNNMTRRRAITIVYNKNNDRNSLITVQYAVFGLNGTLAM